MARWHLLLALALGSNLAAQTVSFAGKERVTVSDLVRELDAIATDLESSAAVAADFDRLAVAHGLATDAGQRKAYARLRLVFECTRDGGLWGVRWTITDREPTSAAIWAQWAKWKAPEGDRPDPLAAQPSADAECDELSALCAFLADKLSVGGVGLFWPRSNHTVVVWTARGKDGKPVRIIVPTSQIFLGEDDTLGTGGFDAASQKTIYTYRHADVDDAFALPAPLARAFIDRTRKSAGLPAADLQRQRNDRSRTVGGS
ncbi:MAG: hypothetical protein U0167_00405 [bacterium]